MHWLTNVLYCRRMLNRLPRLPFLAFDPHYLRSIYSHTHVEEGHNPPVAGCGESTLGEGLFASLPWPNLGKTRVSKGVALEFTWSTLAESAKTLKIFWISIYKLSVPRWECLLKLPNWLKQMNKRLVCQVKVLLWQWQRLKWAHRAYMWAGHASRKNNNLLYNLAVCPHPILSLKTMDIRLSSHWRMLPDIWITVCYERRALVEGICVCKSPDL